MRSSFLPTLPMASAASPADGRDGGWARRRPAAWLAQVRARVSTPPSGGATALPRSKGGAERAPPGPAPTTIGGTDVASLTPSLLRDLTRFDGPGAGQLGWLEVLAAAVRHTQAVRIELRGRAADGAGAAAPPPRLLIDVHPHERVVRGVPVVDGWLDGDLLVWTPTHVAPARAPLPPAAASAAALRAATDAPHGADVRSIGPLLWAVALRGARARLLPELAGQRAYRVPPFTDLDGFGVDAATAGAIARLRRETANFSEISRLHGLGPERTARLLNALYLQSALIISRTHPAATNDAWGGYARRPRGAAEAWLADDPDSR